MSKIPEVPKKRNTKSKTGMRRSHILTKLRQTVNSRSPIAVMSKTELKKHKLRQDLKKTKTIKSKTTKKDTVVKESTSKSSKTVTPKAKKDGKDKS